MTRKSPYPTRADYPALIENAKPALRELMEAASYERRIAVLNECSLKRKLKRLAEKYPDKVYPDRTVHAGAVSYAVPKSCVSVREPFSDERRRAASERAKNAGYTPPARSTYSENE